MKTFLIYNHCFKFYWIKCQILDLKNKQDMSKKKLLKMQLPTTLAIKEQLLEKVDKKVYKLAEESTSNIPFKKK